MISEFSKLTGISESDLLGCGRQQEIVDARTLWWFILRQNGLGYHAIGRLCNRTHATVIHGVKRVEKLIECKDRETIRLYELTKHIKR